MAFDSRPAAEAHAVGLYTRCLLAALRETVPEGVEMVESRRPHVIRTRRFDLFHAPWMEGAVLRCQCPMVVTLHDLDALTRRSERLRRGGMHTRLRHLALQRAAHVIVHSEAMADDARARLGLERDRVVVIPHAPEPPAPISGAAAGHHHAPGHHGGAAGHDHGASGQDGGAGAADSAWGWEEVARATWEVYERALSEPARPFVSRPPAASARPGSS